MKDGALKPSNRRRPSNQTTTPTTINQSKQFKEKMAERYLWASFMALILSALSTYLALPVSAILFVGFISLLDKSKLTE